MKNALRILGIIVATPVALLLIVMLLLYTPAVQNYAVQKASGYISEETGMDVSISYIRLGFPLDLELDGLNIRDCRAGLPEDSLFYASMKQAKVSVALLPLLKAEVKVKELDLQNLSANTASLIKAMRIKGKLERLNISGNELAHLWLNDERGDIDNVLLNGADLNIILADSVPEDTTKSEPTKWVFNIAQLQVQNSTFNLKSSTVNMTTGPLNLLVTNARIDLGEKIYALEHLTADNKNFDFANMLSLNDIHLGLSQLYMDSTHLHIASFLAELPDSRLNGTFDMDMNAFADTLPGQFDAAIDASVSKNSINKFMSGAMPDDIMAKLPDTNFLLSGKVKGNLQKIGFTDITLSLPSIAQLQASGTVRNFINPADIIMNASLKVDVADASIAKAFLTKEQQKQIRIPSGITMNGNLALNGTKATTKMNLRQGKANVNIDGNFDYQSMAYNLKADIDNLNLNDYMPGAGMGMFSGNISSKGNGVDIAHNSIDADIYVRQFKYGAYDLSNLTFKGNLSTGIANAVLKLENKYIDADIVLNGNIAEILNMNFQNPDFKRINGSVAADIHRIDLYGMQMVDHPLTLTRIRGEAEAKKGLMNAKIDSRDKNLYGSIDVGGTLDMNSIDASATVSLDSVNLTNMGFTEQGYIRTLHATVDAYADTKDLVKLNAYISDVSLFDTTEYVLPLDATVELYSDRDTTYASVNAPSMQMELSGKYGYEKIMNDISAFADKLVEQLNDYRIERDVLRPLLPDLSLYAKVDYDAPIMFLLENAGYSFKAIETEVCLRKDYGIDGYLNAEKLFVDSIYIDSLNLAIYEDSVSTKFKADIRNAKDNPQMVFHALADGQLLAESADLGVRIYDKDEKLGIMLGTSAMIRPDSLVLHLTPATPILGYKKYNLNADNYLSLHKGNRIFTNIRLVADDGTGFHVYSLPNETAKQDLAVEVNSFDLTELTSLIPLMPKIAGKLNGDLHIVQTERNWTVASDLGITGMALETVPFGDMGLGLVLIPDLQGGKSILSGTMTKNGNDIAYLEGGYQPAAVGEPKESAMLDAHMELVKFPLDMANGFIPQQVIGFRGNANGQVDISGKMDRLKVNGELSLDSAHLYSGPYGMDFRFGQSPIRVADSKLMLDNFTVYAHNNNPLTVNGNVDFTDVGNTKLDLRMSARDYEIISAKRKPNSMLYGNGYINLMASLKGTLNDLVMNGTLTMLAKSNLTYILQDTPLNNDKRLDGLVTFMDFRDTTRVVKNEKPPLMGFNMTMTLKVEDGTHISCLLNANGSNYINVEGTGELRMKYNPYDDLTLNGRYVLRHGEMKYSLPVIPLQTFNIQEGSYVEFNGDIMNPQLNITATEHNKATVGGGTSGTPARPVDFNVGVKLTQTLQNIGLQFILEAPQDATVASELAMMDEAMRGKLAVSMMTTGLYLSEKNSSNLSMNDALNNFLQNEISNIAGSALQSIDMSMGVSNMRDAGGSSYQDYSFKFSKRLWNNRLNVSIGGKYSTATPSTASQAKIDNLSLEYRLNNTATKMLKLYYEYDKHDIFEGNMTIYSAGFLYKKKISSLIEIFHRMHLSRQMKTKTAQP